MCHFSVSTGQETPLSFGELTTAEEFTIEKEFTTGQGQRGI
jgi:hypothetical protein